MVTSNSNKRISSLEAAGVKIPQRRDVSTTTTSASKKPVDISPRPTSHHRVPYRPMSSHSASHQQNVNPSPRIRKLSRPEVLIDTTARTRSPTFRSSTPPVKDKVKN